MESTNTPPDLSPLFQNPKFNGKTAAEQRQILSEVDPDFGKLSDDDYKSFRSKTKYPLQLATQPDNRPTSDKIIDAIRPFLGPGMGATVGTAVGAASGPFGLVTGPLAGIGTSILADTVAQRSETKPPSSVLSKLAGVTPGSITDNITSALENDLGGRAGGTVIEKGLSTLKGFLKSSPQVENAIQTAYQQRFGNSKISQLLHSLPGISTKDAPGQELTGPSDDVVDDLRKGYSKLTRGGTTTLPGNITSSPIAEDELKKAIFNPNSKIGIVQDLLSDPKKLTRVLKIDKQVGALSDTVTPLREYVLRDALNDPKAGLANFNNPDTKLSMNQLFNGAEQARISGYLSALNKTAPTNKFFNNRYISYTAAGTILSTGLLHGVMTPWGAGATAIAGVKLGTDGLLKLIANPTTSRLMQNMVSGAPLGVSETYAANTIAKALQGITMSQVDTNGQEVKGHLDKDNKFIADQ